MRRFSFIITILLLTLVSCAESGIKEYRNDYQAVPERLTATFEDVESTRIELQELYSVWSAGDEVSVFYHSYSNLKYKFDGNSGDSAGTLSLVAGEQGEATLDKSYMLYPYSENNSLGEDGMLYTSLPAEQSYKANSYGVGGNILVAESEDYLFSLKNVCGWIRIQLTGDGEVVQSITLSSNKDEALAGDVAVNSSDASYTLLSSGGSSITLDCGEGVTLSESVTEFYIGILPQGLEGGITVDIVTDQDSVSKSTYEAVVVERNHILPMTAFRLSGEEALYSELRYTATALVEPYDTSAFNVAIVSNEWDEATGEGVITFDGELTTIGNYAFEDCQSMTSITIPDSVTTLGWGAFTKCSTLREFSGKFATDDGLCLITDDILKAFAIGCGVTEYTIPNDVTSIAHNVFMECVSLTSVTIPDSVTTIGDYTFTWCKNLTTISIGSGVTSIGYAAFVDCNSLTSVYCKATTPPTLDGNGFHDNAEGRKIYVPAESVEAYKAAEYWSEYAADIVGYDFEAGEEVAISNKLFYTATALVEPYDASAFNVSIVSNEWNETTGEGVITFDGELTTIGDYAFRDCDSLTSVTIGDSVTTIGEQAFNYCRSLTSVTIGDSVTTIGNYAFYNCTSLTSVYCKATTPPSLGDDAFKYWDWDESAQEVVNIGCTIYLPAESVEAYKAAEYWSEYATNIVGYNFETGEEVAISNKFFYTATAKVEPYKASAFNVAIVSNEWNETTGEGVITFDGELTTIGNYAFNGCTSLTSVTIPDSVTTIGGRTFFNCDSLTSVTIPDRVTAIGDYAFSDCNSLTSVTIGNSVTTIREGVFADCCNLAEFKGKFAEDGGRCLIIDGVLNAFAIGCGVTEYTIPDSVTTIGYKAFRHCSSLTSVTIPDSVTTIGNEAFSYCDSLTSVTIPDSVTTIGEYAFAYCADLTSVRIPDSVTTIGFGAFYFCESLTSVYCEATTPPTLSSNVFKKYIIGTYINIGCPIYVPAESVEAYKTAENWSEYAADIVGYDFEAGEEAPKDEITDWKTFSIFAEFDDCKCIKGVSNGGNEVAIYLHTLGATKTDALAAGTYPVADWVYTTTSNYCESESTKVNGSAITSGSVTVEGGGDNYTVRFELSDGSNTYKGVYTGALY